MQRNDRSPAAEHEIVGSGLSPLVVSQIQREGSCRRFAGPIESRAADFLEDVRRLGHGPQDGTEVSIANVERGFIVAKKMTSLDAVCVSANTSYRNGPSVDQIRNLFQSGVIDVAFLPHINRVLTEIPRRLVLSAAIEAVGDPALAALNINKMEKAIAAYYAHKSCKSYII